MDTLLNLMKIKWCLGHDLNLSYLACRVVESDSL